MSGSEGTCRTPGSVRWILLLVATGFIPLLAAFFLELWHHAEYQFFPEAIAAAVYFAWTRPKEIPQPWVPGKPVLTALFLGISFAGLVAGLVIWSPWLGAVSALVAGVAAAWWLGGTPLLRAMVPALVMLAVIIPPPLGLDIQFGLFLRSLATTLSSRTLHLAGVVHTVEGHVIALPGQRLLVEEACSGIHSLMFITAFSLFYLLFRRRQIWCYAVVLPAAIAMVVAGNVIRISLGAWLRYHGGLDILTGWKHETLSIVLVILYLALVPALERILPRGRKKECDALPPEDRITPAKPPCKPRLFRRAWTVGCVFVFLGTIGGLRFWQKSQEGVEPLRAARSSLRSGATFRMPDSIGGWSRVDSGAPVLNKIESLGLSTLIWTYQNRGLRAVVAFDYPISGYHDVGGCYINAGWEIVRKEHVARQGDAPERIEIDMKKAPDIYGALWFATMNEQGRRVDAATPERDFFGRFVNLGALRETTYRIQLLIVATHPPDAAERAEAGKLLAGATSFLFPQVLQQLEK